MAVLFVFQIAILYDRKIQNCGQNDLQRYAQTALEQMMVDIHSYYYESMLMVKLTGRFSKRNEQLLWTAALQGNLERKPGHIPGSGRVLKITQQ